MKNNMGNGSSDMLAFHRQPSTIVHSQSSTLQPTFLLSIGFEKVFRFQASRSRMIAGFVGPLLLGVGSGISVTAGFGPLGFSVLLDGLRGALDAPLWLSQFLLTVLFYLVAWKWAKVPLGMGTLPTLLLIGPAISLGATLTPNALPLAGHAVAFASGLILFALGISLAAAASLGPDGVTALSLAAEKRHSIPIAKANFLWNGLAIFIGSALGGQCGAATVIGLFAVSLLIQMFLPRLRGSVIRP